MKWPCKYFSPTEMIISAIPCDRKNKHIPMKKSVLVLIVLVSLLASCSSYTCATYAKKPAHHPKTENKI